MNDIYKDAGFRIRELRESSHLSRERFAEYTEISPKFLYEIETGQKGFSADTLYKISKKLGVSSEYILSGYSIEDENELSAILRLFSPDQIKEIVIMLKAIFKISLK